MKTTPISQVQGLNGCLRGTICETKCPATCVRVLCNKTSSVCSEGCIDGFYGDLCNDLCAANCKDKRCLRGTGRCVKCATGFYGPHCELKCFYCPGEETCDQETGDCNGGSRMFCTCKYNSHYSKYTTNVMYVYETGYDSNENMYYHMVEKPSNSLTSAWLD
ncbi:unnamed protein product [Mytilus edulis]|uniref:Uncharacterized protein n=1 Tax=Mytilus edulis TaxID=6550 RepID=A0A8S3T155_MYTED|nr:unnamed protein product [Mytilus edulis]